jgi:16S rRNA (uracil1498-N3)-methyltransferase
MQLYFEQDLAEGILQLSDDNAKHVVRVLRMDVGDTIELTNGKGNYCTATIADTGKQHCSVKIDKINTAYERPTKIKLAIAFTKNVTRIEWMLEKLVEIGIEEIYPLETSRGERMNFKQERLQKIATAAMCQSKQYFTPIIHDITKLEDLLKNSLSTKLLAHCLDDDHKTSALQWPSDNDFLILIGPEGDFTPNEIDLCVQKGCTPITLGSTRLRTETAGLVACTLLRNLK